MRVTIAASRRARGERRAETRTVHGGFPLRPLRALRENSARHAFTVTESMVAIGLLLVIAGLLAELGVTSLTERRRNSGRQQAQEAAVNILETARACEWEALTPDWARAQRLPEMVVSNLEKAELLVQVEPEPSRAQLRRITVEIRWRQDGKPVRPVRLVSLLAARSMRRPGGKS